MPLHPDLGRPHSFIGWGLLVTASGHAVCVNQPTPHCPPASHAVGVETLNLESAGLDELERLLDRCSGFVLGSPTLGGHMPTQVQTALGTIIRNSNAKQVRGAAAGLGACRPGGRTG